MKIGTRSLLYGVHQLLWHPFVVFLAWKKLYGWPSWQTLLCILVHDWGYFGQAEMNPKDDHHPEFGAWIMKHLAGEEFYWECLLHSRHYARHICGKEPSRLCYADKLSLIYEPVWWYWLRSKLTGELKEYRELVCSFNSDVVRAMTDTEWIKAVTFRMRVYVKEHCDLAVLQQGNSEEARRFKNRQIVRGTDVIYP